MSTDIQTPDFSLNVRYSKADKKNGAEKEDSQVIIYEDKDTSKHRQADLKVNISTTLDKQNVVKERDQLSISLDQARDINRNLAEELHELQSRYEDLGKSKSQLEAELKKLKQELTDILAMLDKQNLVKERDQLSISLDQARDTNRNLAEELHKLQSRYDDLGKNKSQLEVELKKLKEELTGRSMIHKKPLLDLGVVTGL